MERAEAAVSSNEERSHHEFWRLANELRGSFEGRSRLSVLRQAALQGLVPTWRDQAELAIAAGIDDSVDPAIVADFLLAFTEGEQPKRVLDPWAGLGVTVAALESAGRVKSGLAIEINQDVYELIMALRGGSRLQWLLGDASLILADTRDRFDLIVGSPPIGLPATLLKTSNPQIVLRASKTYTMLVQAALTLGPEGALVVLLPESFFAASNLPVREALAAASVYPSAILALPLRVFSTSVAFSLVVLTHHRYDSLFAAELDPSADLGAVVKNLRARKEGNLPHFGRLVPFDKFVSWRAILREEEITQAAQAMALRPVPFADICTAMRAPRRHGPAFVGEPNSIYLPKVGTSPVVTSADSFAIKPQNYLQLIVRPEIADHEYLAAFLNSPLGRKVREGLATGTSIPQISIANLRGGAALLPPRIEQQHSAVRVARRLGELQQSIDQLERELWDQPVKASRIEAGLRQLLEGDGLERWMDTLPFPLASILWRYQAEEDAERSCEYLVHFFTATAMFLVDIHVSALHRDPQVLADVARRRQLETGYARGSIGIWANLLSRLAKRTRDLASKDAPLARELFGVSELERLEAIAKKSLIVALVGEASTYRNNWIGHAAVVGATEWERRLLQVEVTLARVRSALGDAFVGWELVRAGRGGNRGGVITTSIERLVGSRSLFRKASVGLREWPEEGRLYMLETGASLPLRLSPLFSLQRSPDSVEDACYFYDRIEDGGVRWVSYHFEPLPEVVRPDAEVIQLIEELNDLG